MNLQRSFFTTDPLTASRELLGCRLQYQECSGIIVETEAYAGIDDPACHTFTRPSTRKFLAEHPPGTAYVYFNYGMYWLFNILVKGKDERNHGFVLVRGVRPCAGIELMRERRLALRKKKKIADEELCNGPGKLAQAFSIDGSHHGIDLFNDDAWSLKVREEDLDESKIIATPRIGISQAKERLWRFVLEV